MAVVFQARVKWIPQPLFFLNAFKILQVSWRTSSTQQMNQQITRPTKQFTAWSSSICFRTRASSSSAFDWVFATYLATTHGKPGQIATQWQLKARLSLTITDYHVQYVQWCSMSMYGARINVLPRAYFQLCQKPGASAHVDGVMHNVSPKFWSWSHLHLSIRSTMKHLTGALIAQGATAGKKSNKR